MIDNGMRLGERSESHARTIGTDGLVIAQAISQIAQWEKRQINAIEMREIIRNALAHPIPFANGRNSSISVREKCSPSGDQWGPNVYK